MISAFEGHANVSMYAKSMYACRTYKQAVTHKIYMIGINFKVGPVPFQVLHDIDMVIRSFETTNKLPDAISEMLLFRKDYYLDQFLPALLKKP
jgi:hypothetical protein